MFLTELAYDKKNLHHADWWDVYDIMSRKSERDEGIGRDLTWRGHMYWLKKTTITLVEMAEIWTQDLSNSKPKIVQLGEKSWKSNTRITELQ